MSISQAAQRLRSIRISMKLSQAEMARYLGVRPDTLSRYELGKRPVSCRRLEAAEKIFQLFSQLAK